MTEAGVCDSIQSESQRIVSHHNTSQSAGPVLLHMFDFEVTIPYCSSSYPTQAYPRSAVLMSSWFVIFFIIWSITLDLNLQANNADRRGDPQTCDVHGRSRRPTGTWYIAKHAMLGDIAKDVWVFVPHAKSHWVCTEPTC